MTGASDRHEQSTVLPESQGRCHRRLSPVVPAAVSLLLYAVVMAVGGMKLALAGPGSDDLSVRGHTVAGWLFGLGLVGLALVYSIITASAVVGRREARIALVFLAALTVPGELYLALHYLAIRTSSFWWLGVAGSLHAPLLVVGVALLLLPAATTRERDREGHLQPNRDRHERTMLGAVLLLAYEALDVGAGTYAITVRPRPELADLMMLIGLILGVIGLGYLIVTMASLLSGDRALTGQETAIVADPAGRQKQAVRPWSVVLAAILLLAYEVIWTAAGMYTLRNQQWEDLAGILTIVGLLVGLIGLAHLVLTVPLLLGRRWARGALTVLTLPLVVAYATFAAVNFPGDLRPTNWVALSILLTGPLPAIGVVLLFLPASQPFFHPTDILGTLPTYTIR